MRDLREDLEHGLVNIPSDVVAAAKAEGASLADFDALIETQAIRTWYAMELERAQRLLDAVADRVPDATDTTGERILRTFHRSMARFARRFEWKYAIAAGQQAIMAPGTD